MANVFGPPREFTKKFASLQGAQGAQLSDFAIICGARTWPVHRVFLFSHSDVLGAAVTRPFKEATDAQFDLSADPEPCVEALVNCLYSFAYDIPVSNKEPPSVFHLRMNIIADKYNIFDLKIGAIMKFTLEIRSLSGFNIISDDDLATAADIAYEAALATTAIRAEIVQAASKRQSLLRNTGVVFGPASAFETLMGKHAQLGIDMAKEMIRKSDQTESTQKRPNPFDNFESGGKHLKTEKNGTGLSGGTIQQPSGGGGLFGVNPPNFSAGGSLFGNNPQRSGTGGGFSGSTSQTATAPRSTSTPCPAAPQKQSAPPPNPFAGFGSFSNLFKSETSRGQSHG